MILNTLECYQELCNQEESEVKYLQFWGEKTCPRIVYTEKVSFKIEN